MSNLSVNELSTYRWSFEDDVECYASRGFDGIGVWRSKLVEYGVEKGAELLSEQGLAVSSLGWAGGFTGSDGGRYCDAIHDALDAIETAAAINAGCLIVVAGDRNGHTHRHARRLFSQALTELSEAASALHIDLAIEPMHAGSGSEGCFLHNIQRTLDVIGDIGWPGVGIVFDSYHLGHDPSVLQWLPSVAPLVRLVQLADGRHAPIGEQDRCLLGDGVLPVREIIRCLEDNGYEGFYELELIGESVENLHYERVIDHSRMYLESCLPSLAKS